MPHPPKKLSLFIYLELHSSFPFYYNYFVLLANAYLILLSVVVICMFSPCVSGFILKWNKNNNRILFSTFLVLFYFLIY